MSASTPEVSIVIPTIEEEAVFDLIKEIRQLLGNDTEIIIVDKSSDAYFERLKKTNAIVVKQEGKGVEKAVAQGLRLAKGKILGSIDGDGTHDPKGLVDAVKMIKEGKADLVLGNRMAHLEKGAMNAYIKAGNKMLSWLFSKLYGVEVHDILTGLFAIRREVFEDLRDIEPYRAGVATTYTIEAIRRGYKIAEVGIRYGVRKAGPSKISSHKTSYAISVAANMIRQVRDYSPLLIFGLFGLILVIIGIVIAALVFASFLSTGRFTEVGRALIAFMLLVLGILSIFVGIMLDLMLEIDREVRELKARTQKKV